MEEKINCLRVITGLGVLQHLEKGKLKGVVEKYIRARIEYNRIECAVD